MTTIMPSTAAATSGDSGSSALAPDNQTTQQQLTTSINANVAITAYAHALQNVVLNPVANQGSWFDDFKASLTTAQQHAQAWVNTLGPQVFSTVPQSIINYGNTFTAATNNILSIINSLPPEQPPTPQQQTEIVDLINAVLAVLTNEQATVAEVQKALQQFAIDVQSDHTALLTGQNSAENQVQIDSTQLDKIKAQINSVTAKMQSDSQKAMMSEIGLGVAIFVIVAGIALAVATGGAAAPLVAVAVGVVGVGAAIAGTVIYSKDVAADMDKLGELQGELSDEQKQVSALQGIITSIGGLVAANELATQAISQVLNTWATLQAKLEAVVSELQQAEAPNVPALIESLDLQVAQTDWNQLVQFCQGMEQSATSVQVQVIQPPQQKAA